MWLPSGPTTSGAILGMDLQFCVEEVRECSAGLVPYRRQCVDVDECRVSRWIRFVIGWLRHHHHHHHHLSPGWLGHLPHLLPTTTPPPTWNPAPRTTTTPPPNDNHNGEIHPIPTTTPKPTDDPNDPKDPNDPNDPNGDLTTPSPILLAVGERIMVPSFGALFVDVYPVEDGRADSFFDVFFDIDVGNEPGRAEERIAELLRNTIFRDLVSSNRTLLESFFDIAYEIELGNRTLPELCENGTCVNTNGTFLCEACNCSLPGHARECAAKPSEQCPDPSHCHELYPSACEEGESGKCECVCPDGQHLHRGAGSVLTHALTHVENAGIAGGLWYCADDVCNCSRHRLCATEADASICQTNSATPHVLECKPREHCWTDVAGVERCVALFNSSCVEADRTNTSKCACVCEDGYIPHPFLLEDLSTSNVGSMGQYGRRWLLFCIDVDECQGGHGGGGAHNVGEEDWVDGTGDLWPSNTCHEDATCSNTVGSFTCHCGEGFVGNGTHCREETTTTAATTPTTTPTTTKTTTTTTTTPAPLPVSPPKQHRLIALRWNEIYSSEYVPTMYESFCPKPFDQYFYGD